MNPSAETNLLEVEKLRRVHDDAGGKTVALDSVSLQIKAGEFISIMGKSGSGKSTLLHLLGLLDRPTSGKYVFRGRDTSSLTDEELARIRNENIGFVFQAFHLLGRNSVLDNVMLPLVYSHIPVREHRAMALKALEQVEMSHRVEYFPTQLSGGEKQRVAIARALVNTPDLIFADEPTGNLDTKTGEKVMQIIDALHEEGHTVILVTHELSTASFAERIIELQDGSVISDRPSAGRHAVYQK